MKVLILGGYGVFGSRLARLLLRDGHAVTIAGRDGAAADLLAAQLRCAARVIDRQGDLSALAGFDVVVDAAGPFQAYGHDRYRLAHAAIAAGVHYLDLSDDAGFCAGIATLNDAARAAGVAVISGLSTVPAMSSAAVVALAAGDPVRLIDSAILPGNRAPRGLSVIRSILLQAGRPVAVYEGGQWRHRWGWSDPADYPLPGGLTRQAWHIGAPDLALFPAHFGAATVRFRAGLELWVMRYGLAGFAMLRRVLPLPAGLWTAQLFRWAAGLLAGFGTGQGGMSVTIAAGGDWRCWHLLAEDGDGPFVPAVATRALLRRASLPIGARVALGVVTLAEVEAAMADLSIRTERQTTPRRPLFATALGAGLAALPPEITATHDIVHRGDWAGRASVTRGTGLWPRLLAALFRFPPATGDTPVQVTKEVRDGAERWTRRFGTRRFRSHLSPMPGGVQERFGPFTFALELTPRDGALHYGVRAGRLGPLPLPRWALPRSEAREYVQDGRFRFDVAIHAPLTDALIVRYRGWLVARPPEDPLRPPG